VRLSVRRERLDADLPSRVADNLFWLGRHIERAEQIVRLLRSLVTYVTREDMSEGVPELAALLHVLADMELIPAQLKDPLPLPQLEHQVSLLFRFDAPPDLLRVTLGEVRRIAAAVRDRLSNDTWRILNQLQQDSRPRQRRVQFDEVLVHLNRMITDLAAFSGMEGESMTRGHGWLFLDIGRRLERSLGMTRLVRSAIEVSPSHVAILEPLLEVADSSMTYRRRYFAEAQLPPVLDLLLADGTNPRALRFQLDTMSVLLSHLPRHPRAPSPTHEERTVAHAIAALRAADFDALSQPGADVAFDQLTAVLDVLDADLRAVSDAITFHYFSHAEQRVN